MSLTKYMRLRTTHYPPRLAEKPTIMAQRSLFAGLQECTSPCSEIYARVLCPCCPAFIDKLKQEEEGKIFSYIPRLLEHSSE